MSQSYCGLCNVHRYCNLLVTGGFYFHHLFKQFGIRYLVTCPQGHFNHLSSTRGGGKSSALTGASAEADKLLSRHQIQVWSEPVYLKRLPLLADFVPHTAGATVSCIEDTRSGEWKVRSTKNEKWYLFFY
ncbi:unnamed protein product [Choristocarpus tenellus]